MADLFERAIRKLEGNSVKSDESQEKKAKREGETQSVAPSYGLDFSVLQRFGFLSPETMQGRMGEEYRIIKRLLLMSAFGKGVPQVERGNAVVVTSSLEGEGKTFTSFNLAVSIAQERDSTVLLIDADLARRTLSGLFDAQKARGLSDLLVDPTMDPASVIAHTTMDKLRFIPAGTPQENAAELLASSQMERIVTELVSRYEDRVILFDSPPLLASSQASMLTQLAGQVLMVVEDGRTPQSALQEATGMIDDNKLLGMVLNCCSESRGGGYYGGYSGQVVEVEE